MSKLLIAFVAAAGAAAVFSGPPGVGAAAPQFALKNQDGVETKLTDFRSQWVVLYFYPRDFTSGCTVEAHNFERDRLSYEKLNAVILGVSVDAEDSHKAFCAKEGLNFRLLADTEHKVAALYGSLGEYQGKAVALRNTFVIDPEGKIARVFEHVKPEAHSAEVLAALAELERNR